MQVGPIPLAYVYFVLVKYAGYAAHCRYVIQPRVTAFDKPIRPAWIVGGVRTLIGVTIGAVALALWKIPAIDHAYDSAPEILFWVVLIPAGFAEWWVVLRVMYRNSMRISTRVAFVAGGTLASLALDWIGMVFAVTLPGGLRMC
jgi:hypothetical protein